MNLFPERAYRSGRRFLLIALVFSLLIHLAGGGVWAWFARAVIASARATGPVSEVVALSDAITIEHRNVPRESNIARAPRKVTPQHTVTAPAAAAASVAAPALPAVAVAVPAPAKKTRPVPRVVVHRQRRDAPPVPPTVPPEPAKPEPRGGAFSAEQMAALDAQSRATIAAAQRAVIAGPAMNSDTSTARASRERPAADQQRNAQIMGGSPEEFRAQHLISGEGECVPLQGPFPSGRLRGYYIRCMVHYSDAFFEEVSFPWPFYFPPSKDPFDYRSGVISFPGQDPPPGFTLSPNFALSRTVCAYFKARCAAIVEAERNRGDPAYGKPP